MPYKRILVKLSGEALQAPDGYWLDAQTLAALAEDVARAHAAGYEIALVVGGGNIIRGARMSAAGWIDRATADSMGMLATVMNSLALETALNAAGVSARTMSAVSMPTICETYARQPALHHLEKGQVVVLAGGHRQPVLHHRHLRRAARRRAALRRGPQGDAGRRRLFRRPQARPGRAALRPDHPRRGHRARSQGDGHGRLRARPRAAPADRGGQRARAVLGAGDPGGLGPRHDRSPLDAQASSA